MQVTILQYPTLQTLEDNKNDFQSCSHNLHIIITIDFFGSVTRATLN